MKRYFISDILNRISIKKDLQNNFKIDEFDIVNENYYFKFFGA